MNIIKTCVNFLGIVRPYKIELISRKNVKVDGLYWATYSDKKGKLTHNIRIYLGNPNRILDSTIAHEFIHAWQEEQKLTETHGPEFAKMAQALYLHTGLPGIYNRETDI